MTKLGSSYEKAQLLRSLTGRCTLNLRSGCEVTIFAEDIAHVRNFDVTLRTGDVYQFTDVWCIDAYFGVLIDWVRAPRRYLSEFTSAQLRAEYVRRVPGAKVLRGGVTYGSGTVTNGVPRKEAVASGKLLPNGWRLIRGGAL